MSALVDCRLSNRRVGRIPRYGIVLVDVRLSPLRAGMDVHHHPVDPGVPGFAASGSVWRTVASPGCWRAGQVLDVLADPNLKPERGVTRADLLSLHALWQRWHLNGMRAACAHQSPGSPAGRCAMTTIPFRVWASDRMPRE